MKSHLRFDELSTAGRVAFAVRCARRVRPLLGTRWANARSEHLDTVDRALEYAEAVAAGISNELYGYASLVSDFEKEIADSTALHAFRAVHWAIEAARRARWAGMLADHAADHASDEAYSDWGYADREVDAAAEAAFEAALKGAPSAENALREDYSLLVEASGRDCVPKDFFALNSVFETHARVGEYTIIQVASLVELRLLEAARDPENLLSLSARDFEELVAELLNGLGYDIELTSRTRDGGRDIIAVCHRPAHEKFLIECKRWSSHKPVGIDVVQRLHGVACAERATKGILATTSRFTAPAKLFLEQQHWVLEGRDFEGLVEWLDLYQKIRIAKLVCPDSMVQRAAAIQSPRPR